MSAANEPKAGGSKPSVQLAREPAQGVWSGVMSVDFASFWLLRSSGKVSYRLRLVMSGGGSPPKEENKLNRVMNKNQNNNHKTNPKLQESRQQNGLKK